MLRHVGPRHSIRLLAGSAETLERTSARGAQEECRGWDVNEVVFTPALWPTYQALMRADFTLFDEYEFRGAGTPLSTERPCA